MTDQTLLERFIENRDEEAFEAIVRRHGPMVLHVCRDILPGDHDAEDAFQATFLVLVRNAEAIRDRGALSRWLYGVAYRIAVRAKSKTVKDRVRYLGHFEGGPAVPPQSDEAIELRPIVHAELNRLPEQLRDPIILCDLEGYTVESAARRLDCPLGTIKGRLSRGRSLLRSRLSRRGLGVAPALLAFLLARPRLERLPAELVASTLEMGRLASEGASNAALVTPQVTAWVTDELETPGGGEVRRFALALTLLIGFLPTSFGVIAAESAGVEVLPEWRKSRVNEATETCRVVTSTRVLSEELSTAETH